MTATYQQSVFCTTCPYCGVGCGVDATVINGTITSVKGTETHPANHGKLCVKGSHLADTVGDKGRITQARVDGQIVSTEDATTAVAERFVEIINTHGPQAVAFYVSGQILTEDYYVANKLMKGYIGTANIDTNSRLCMSSAVAAYKRSLGSDTVPTAYTDLSETSLLVLVGSNAAWTHPILFQQMQQAKRDNPELKVVVIDPRASATCDIADLHIGLAPGSDTALFNGLLAYLIEHDALDETFIANHTEHFATVKATASDYDLSHVAQICDVATETLGQFYQWFATAPSAITFYSQGVNQSIQGVDKCNAIINCHLATGQIGRAGAGPFSITGQPNAMGGREVGGLANMLAAHMEIHNEQHRAWVQEFWQSPTMCNKPGLKAVDLFADIASGKVKAVWVMATNPAVSLPNRNAIERALAGCECVVVSECFSKNDTLQYADIVLPSSTWGEKNGTVTNSERRISRQRGLIDPPGDAWHDWELICAVAKKMGFTQGFDYSHPYEIFCEHAALSGYRNGGDDPVRDFDISGLADLTQPQYDALKPIQWPVNQQNPYGTQRMFSDKQFFTPSGKAQFIAVSQADHPEPANAQFPLVLNSGRNRDQWHTMTRTGRSSTLATSQAEPTLKLATEDAQKNGIKTGDLVRVSSSYGEITLPFEATNEQRSGTCFAPIHWTAQTSPTANVSRCYSSRNDPLSGQPDSKYVAVSIAPVTPRLHVQIISRDALALNADYWTALPVGEDAACTGYIAAVNDDASEESANNDNAPSLDSVLRTMFASFEGEPAGEWVHYIDAHREQITAALIVSGQLSAIAFMQPQKHLQPWSWLAELMLSDVDVSTQLGAILLRDVPALHRAGKTICACYQVGENTIKDHIDAHADTTVESLGKALKCGTNCGSCRPELQQIITQHTTKISL